MARKDTKQAARSKGGGRRQTTYKLPYEGFPLSPHPASGRWYRKHKNRRYYFGRLDDWEAALKRYEREWPEIIAGRDPRRVAEDDDAGIEVSTGVNTWLAARVEDAEAGQLSPLTLRDYRKVAELVVGRFGRQTPISWLGPDDFRKLGQHYRQKLGRAQASKAFTITRQIFNWLFQNEHIDAPPRYGTDFKLGKREGQQARTSSEQAEIFTADQLRALLAATEAGVKGEGWRKGNEQPDGVRPSPQLRAMILLAICGAYTQAELAGLRIDEVDLDKAIIDHRRAKTGARRTVPLWPEVVEAVRDALDQRPTPKAPEAEGLLFVTKRGFPWVREKLTVSDADDEGGKADMRTRRVDSIGLQFRKLANATGARGRNLGFGKIRHTHATVADEVGDPHAAMRIRGHDVPGVSRFYVADISHERLRAVSEHVRHWLGLDATDRADGIAGRIGKAG